MRAALCILAFLFTPAARAQLDDTVVITPPTPTAPQPPRQVFPQAPAVTEAKPEPEPPEPVKSSVRWASPKTGGILFRPATVTLDWASTCPEGTLYSVTMGNTPNEFPVEVADNVLATSIRWTLPDVPRTTVYVRVKAMSPDGDVLDTDAIPVHILPRDAIVVSKANQRLWAFQDGRLRQRFLISTGDVDYDTRAGWFTVYLRHRDHHSTLYDVDMPYALFFSGGQAIHASTALRHLGRRASHGCVRLPRAHARQLYEDSTVGRTVIVTPWSDDMSFLDALVPSPKKPAPRVAGR